MQTHLQREVYELAREWIKARLEVARLDQERELAHRRWGDARNVEERLQADLFERLNPTTEDGTKTAVQIDGMVIAVNGSTLNLYRLTHTDED